MTLTVQIQGAAKGRQAAQVHGEAAQEEQQQGPPLAAGQTRRRRGVKTDSFVVVFFGVAVDGDIVVLLDICARLSFTDVCVLQALLGKWKLCQNTSYGQNFASDLRKG